METINKTPYQSQESPSKKTELNLAHSIDRALPFVNLLGVQLHTIREQECIDFVLSQLDANRAGTIITVNLDHLRRFNIDPEYRQFNQNATLRVADGMPLIWASRIQGTPIPERVTGSNLIWSLTGAAAQHGRSLFLLGGEPGTADKTASILMQRYPKLQIVGTACPEYGFENSEQEITKIADMLASAQPDLVYVALGSPRQDNLIDKLCGRMPAVWWMGVGISFSFVSGAVTRAPLWMQQSGLEWLHRLLQEPKRLAGRYLVDGLPFAGKLFIHAFRQRLARIVSQ